MAQNFLQGEVLNLLSSDGGGGTGAVDDVQINETSITVDGVANIPDATETVRGATVIGYGLKTMTQGGVENKITVKKATLAQIDAKQEEYCPITPSILDYAVTSSLGVVASFANSSTVTINKNKTHTASANITSVTIAYPSTLDNSFVSEVQFTTGTGTITFGVDTGTVMKGDDCSNGTFTPLASSTYSIIFAYNGTTKYAIVVKVA